MKDIVHFMVNSMSHILLLSLPWKQAGSGDQIDCVNLNYSNATTPSHTNTPVSFTQNTPQDFCLVHNPPLVCNDP